MLPGTQVWSRARTKALFDEEQRFIAPGLQTIALLSELAIESFFPADEQTRAVLVRLAKEREAAAS